MDLTFFHYSFILGIVCFYISFVSTTDEDVLFTSTLSAVMFGVLAMSSFGVEVLSYDTATSATVYSIGFALCCSLFMMIEFLRSFAIVRDMWAGNTMKGGRY